LSIKISLLAFTRSSCSPRILLNEIRLFSRLHFFTTRLIARVAYTQLRRRGGGGGGLALSSLSSPLFAGACFFFQQLTFCQLRKSQSPVGMRLPANQRAEQLLIARKMMLSMAN
jgi:hypothetical protein